MGGVSPLSSSGAPSGSLTLVTPIRIRSGIAAFSDVPAFGVLTLHFVPEPRPFALLAGALAALAVCSRRLRR
jgi:hypothetical protein